MIRNPTTAYIPAFYRTDLFFIREWERPCFNRRHPAGTASSSLLLSSLELSDTKVHEPSIRALLGTASHFCEVVVLTLRTPQEPPGSGGRGLRPDRLSSSSPRLQIKLVLPSAEHASSHGGGRPHPPSGGKRRGSAGSRPVWGGGPGGGAGGAQGWRGLRCVERSRDCWADLGRLFVGARGNPSRDCTRKASICLRRVD